MAGFVSGAEYAGAITDVIGGADVRCGVAFWGGGSVAALGTLAGRRARIVCDVTMGGTSAEALRDLGAPENDDLRHLVRLHAKVYISERGVIVGSANASRNGIGFDGPPLLVEAGVLFATDEPAALAAAVWFETIWRAATRVDEEALEIAERRFRPGMPTIERTARSGSLLDLIRLAPDRFAGISIVLVKTPSTDTDRKRARKAVRAAHPGKAAKVDAMPANGMFMGWDRSDLDRWTRTFIELWMPNNRLHAYGRRAYFFEDATGTVMSRVRWSAVRKLVADDLPTPEQIAEADADLVRRLIARHGDAVFTPAELASALVKL